MFLKSPMCLRRLMLRRINREICIGKGNENWLCSAPHGAGRLMLRAQVAKEIDMAASEDSN